MKFSRVIVAAAMTTTSLMSVAGSAHAAPEPGATTAEVVGTVKIDRDNPDVAYVLARYRCTVADPENNPAHLWVSVKQNESRTADPAVAAPHAGWGGGVHAWRDSHRNPVNCDGKMHTERFAVDEVEGKQAWDALAKGKGWVQFCLFDDTTPKGDGETDFGQPVSSMVWANVH